MEQPYKIVSEGGVGEITEKKSRFLATVFPCEEEADALSFIESMKKTYWDASHNCSAYTIGRSHELTRCSDDGEPQKTAGRPMLEVLLSEDVHNVCVVVTRYFGGTLLGTGGLVRAYQAAVKEGLAHSTVAVRTPGRRLTVTTDYNSIGRIQYALAESEVLVLSTEYTDIVTLTLFASPEQRDAVIRTLTEVTAGKARIAESDPCWMTI